MWFFTTVYVHNGDYRDCMFGIHSMIQFICMIIYLVYTFTMVYLHFNAIAEYLNL
jgi:hypothetical protein